MEVLLTEPEIHAKIPSHSVDCILGEGQLYALPLMGEGLRDIQYNTSMVLDTRFHIWFVMTFY